MSRYSGSHAAHNSSPGRVVAFSLIPVIALAAWAVVGLAMLSTGSAPPSEVPLSAPRPERTTVWVSAPTPSKVAVPRRTEPVESADTSAPPVAAPPAAVEAEPVKPRLSLGQLPWTEADMAQEAAEESAPAAPPQGHPLTQESAAPTVQESSGPVPRPNEAPDDAHTAGQHPRTAEPGPHSPGSRAQRARPDAPVSILLP
ncbi:hypothetical protein LO762_19175 [Actinocorallia sp. API 0066]|uniref:hypothetical protein n=1 Tax=Actinocorallia sp. API 0066 TaxID=2896846 RepID=UPI001E30A108|nr:hypothetical protein [Actinocorallia sp. API 0066]MCD0451304.1 hypothetical protein [Actinocorallia sp. API 0066]